jgi:hypothetical protein
MFSIVIPTIWSPQIQSIDKLIENLSLSSQVLEIILINNNPNKYSNRYIDNQKVKELCFNNIYVNESWNVGVLESKSNSICLMMN